MILRTPAEVGTSRLRHLVEAHMFAECNTLLKAASLRGVAAVWLEPHDWQRDCTRERLHPPTPPADLTRLWT